MVLFLINNDNDKTPRAPYTCIALEKRRNGLKKKLLREEIFKIFYCLLALLYYNYSTKHKMK